MVSTKKIIIVGAGPAGLLLAHDLVRRENYDIILLEKRPDPWVVVHSNLQTLRSFPIALNLRGLSSLDKFVGLQAAIEEEGIYCKGVCLHNARSRRYKPPRVIMRSVPSLSVDRNRMTMTILNELRKVEPAKNTALSIRFDTELGEIVSLYDNEANGRISLRVTSNESRGKSAVITCDHLVAADGGNSVIRRYLVTQGGLINCSEKEIPDDYKTIFLSRNSPDGKICLDGDKIHGWMIQNPSLKLISAPVLKDCVSGALIFDKGQDPFADMKTGRQVHEWLMRICPTLSQLVTEDEATKLLHRPVSTTIAVRCDRLNVGSKVLLLGDAAHSMSASVGQGCNSSLQDVQIFGRILDQQGDNWSVSLDQFTQQRMPDIHAVSELSEYSAPRSRWMKVEWMLRILLGKVLPKWLSCYILRPLPMELLMETSLPYRDIYEQTLWWTNRVKRSYKDLTMTKGKLRNN